MNFKKITLKILAFVMTFSLTLNTANAWKASVSAGHTLQSEYTFRVSFIEGWDNRFLESSFGYATGYFDVGLTYWESGKYDSGFSVSAAPVFKYVFDSFDHVKPYVEVGVGIAAFNKTKIADKNLGSSFNFEDRIGFGFNIGTAHEFGVRIIHYSNAGLKNPNDGIETISLFYSYKF